MLNINQLLDLANNAMLKNVKQLKFLRGKWAGTGRGIERWFQIELMAEIHTSSNLNVKLLPKGPDLRIEDKLVELRTPTDYSVNWIKDGLKHKPEPDIVLFLAVSSDKFLEKLRKLERKGYKINFRHITSTPDWVIGCLTKI